jgi:hypothetical protein
VTTPDTSPQNNKDGWAKPVEKLKVEETYQEAVNLNVDGRKLSGLTHGFGQLWQKTYKVRLSGIEITPQDVIKSWKEHFSEFWPEGNDLYVPLTGIQPGEVGLINLSAPGGLKLSTGVMVIYADDVSFSFMTPEGHMFAGMITFSAFEEDNGTFAQVQALIRANDPVYEMSFRIGFGHKSEDAFWDATLKNLAQHLGVANPQPTQTNSLVDPRMQWAEWRNIWNNAGIRSGLYMPVAMVKKYFHEHR